MGIEYRPAGHADIPSVATVFATAINDLNRKHGFLDEPAPASPPNPQYAFWLSQDPNSFWVAHDGRRVVGYSYSFMRGSLWFLADLFILPAYQGRGIGKELIRRTLGSWRGRRIANRTLITPSFNRVSVSLYMKFGMLPRQPIYFASAPRNAAARGTGQDKPSDLEAEEVEDFQAADPTMSQIHRLALGFPPGWHNELFAKVQQARCLIFKRKRRPEGYAFFRRNGRIGPLVVRSESCFRPALEATLRQAAESDGDRLTMFFAGTNREAVLASSRHGFRITYPTLFLSSKPMGDWNNYLFYSPGLM